MFRHQYRSGVELLRDPPFIRRNLIQFAISAVFELLDNKARVFTPTRLLPPERRHGE
jgi:hypothetical protein